MADMPSIPTQAIAPMDYSGTYGKVASTIAGGGQMLDKAMNDYATFEKSREKEQMRQQALLDLYTSKPYMKEVVRPDIDAKDIGRGWAQMAASGILYDKLAGLKVPVPEQKIRDQATFMSSEKAWDLHYAALEKQVAEAEKTQSEAGAASKIGGALKNMPAGATAEEIKRRTLEEVPEAAAGANTGTLGLLAGAGQKQTDIDKAAIAEKKIKVDQNRARIYADKVGQDTFNKDQLAMQSSVLALDKIVTDKRKTEKDAENLITNKDIMVMKGANADEIDGQIKEKYKKSKEYEAIIKHQRTIANAASKRFDSKYPGVRMSDPDIDDLLQGDLEDTGKGGGSSDGAKKPTRNYNPTTGQFEDVK